MDTWITFNFEKISVYKNQIFSWKVFFYDVYARLCFHKTNEEGFAFL